MKLVTLKHLAAVLVTTVVMWGLMQLSLFEIKNHISSPLLRVALRFQSNKVSECRPYNSTELAQIPIHMRQAQYCEVNYVPYHLEIALDDKIIMSRELNAGGKKSDRPLILIDELRLDAGDHRIQVSLTPAQKESPKEQLESYSLSKQVSVQADDILLLRFDELVSNLTLTSY